MLKLTALTLLALTMVTLPAKAGWYLIPGISKHVNTSTPHNALNLGFGMEDRWRGRNWQIGIYRNSYWKTSAYVMTELTAWQISDNLRFRFNGGGVTGYRYPVTPMVIPVLTYETKKWGTDVLTIPPLGKDHMGVFAIQLKLRF